MPEEVTKGTVCPCEEIPCGSCGDSICVCQEKSAAYGPASKDPENAVVCISCLSEHIKSDESQPCVHQSVKDKKIFCMKTNEECKRDVSCYIPKNVEVIG